MRLKEVIDSPCGIRHMMDKLELQSGYARRWLLDTTLLTREQDIQSAYAVLQRFALFIEQVDHTHLNTLLFKLQCLKDIRTTIQNLKQRATLDDIELFEVKHLAILATDVAALLRNHGMDGVVAIPDLNPVIAILDPDGMKIATFYIYDSYCEQLRDLRTQMRQHPDQQEELLVHSSELEQRIRDDLSQQLHPYATAIEQAQQALAQIDVNVAKARQMHDLGLCFPTLSDDGTTSYHDMFHPQVKEALANRGKTFQPVDIAFGLKPTLITGSNMGGKTVVLKTVTLCQLLTQFIFGIPASQAQVAVKDEIRFCIGDDQSVERGLSSFAAEMKHIDAVIQTSRTGCRLLALIDEPARTTNPVEGTALVSALLRVLANTHCTLLMTTHYDVEASQAHCLRVKGLIDGSMDYSLVEVHNGEVPHEALRIAESLGIDSQWLDQAKAILSPNHQQTT
ncbi:MAG: DNA mismatch repair protein MutS [Muribaculaceae bacterium]|nr:DNA mismatch repair protein MutS [Muribaculaceae bacterium]